MALVLPIVRFRIAPPDVGARARRGDASILGTRYLPHRATYWRVDFRVRRRGLRRDYPDRRINVEIESEPWANAVSTLISAIKDGRPGDGFVAAVDLCGEQLARPFPPGARNPDERPDKVVEI